VFWVLTSPYTALLEHVKAEGSLEAARELLLRELALNGEAMRREQSELMRTRQEQLDQDFLIGLSQNLGLKLHLINGTVNMSHGTAGPVIISEEVEEGLPVYLHGDSGHFKVLLSTPHRTQKNEEDIFKSKGFVSSTLRHLGNLSPTSVPNYKFSPRKSGW